MRLFPLCFFVSFYAHYIKKFKLFIGRLASCAHGGHSAAQRHRQTTAEARFFKGGDPAGAFFASLRSHGKISGAVEFMSKNRQRLASHHKESYPALVILGSLLEPHQRTLYIESSYQGQCQNMYSTYVYSDYRMSCQHHNTLRSTWASSGNI